MILKTKNFQEAANKILVAVGLDRSAANLELAAKDTALYFGHQHWRCGNMAMQLS